MPTPPRQPSYPFRRRGDRRRVALRLARGMALSGIAAIERTPVGEVLRLLEDAGFARLVEHHRRLADLPEEARLDLLSAEELALLELALSAGDVRAALSF